jgi:hypothetical protein
LWNGNSPICVAAHDSWTFGVDYFRVYRRPLTYRLNLQVPTFAVLLPYEPIGCGITETVPERIAYRGPIVIETTTTIRAAAFDAQGQPVGHPAGKVSYREEKPP